MPQELDETAKVLIEMLTENTGIHGMDSGGKSGRAWQRNQGRTFLDEKEAAITFWGDFPSISVNLFHFLHNTLHYNKELDEAFLKFANANEELSYHACMRPFIESLKDVGDILGLYGDLSGVWGDNTYNQDNCLSQDFQFDYWEDDNGAHILLEIHGGADIRGGYTIPRGFDVSSDSFTDWGSCGLSCGKCHAGWSSRDGGFCWESYEAHPNLEDYQVIAIDSPEAATIPEEPAELLKKLKVSLGGTPKETDISALYPENNDVVAKATSRLSLTGNVLLTVPDYNLVLCPICGTPMTALMS